MHYYKQLDDRVKDMWGGKQRENLALQPFVKDVIVDALFHKPQKLCSGIEGDINSWYIHMKIDHFCQIIWFVWLL